jgi:hypothetical protein
MAKRGPGLAIVDLKAASGTPAPKKEHARGKRASTLRLPPEQWRQLRIAAALRNTSSQALVQLAVAEFFERNPLPDNLGSAAE